MRRAQSLKTKAKIRKSKAPAQSSDSESDGSDCGGCPACIMTSVLERMEADMEAGSEAKWDEIDEGGLEFGIRDFKEFMQRKPNHYSFKLLLERAESMLSKMTKRRLALEQYERVRRSVKNASKKARRKESKTISILISNVAKDACANVVKAASKHKVLPEIETLAISAPDKLRVASSFECPVCLDYSDERLALNCGHVYCTGCAPSVDASCYVCSKTVALQIKLFNC